MNTEGTFNRESCQVVNRFLPCFGSASLHLAANACAISGGLYQITAQNSHSSSSCNYSRFSYLSSPLLLPNHWRCLRGIVAGVNPKLLRLCKAKKNNYQRKGKCEFMRKKRYLSNPSISADPQKCRHCRNCKLACAAARAKMDLKSAMIQRIPLVARNRREMCIGCKTCMPVCPFGAKGADKCDLCFDRLIQGKQPACIQACPSHSLVMIIPDGWSQAHMIKQNSQNQGRVNRTEFGQGTEYSQ